MNNLKNTARIAGLWYLGLAITGAIGFLVIRPAIYVSGDPAATASNLASNPSLAHLGIALELGAVIAQALAALWFYRLFREFSQFAAGSLAAFGFVNAVALLASAAFLATALAVSSDASLAPGGDVAATIQLLYVLSAGFWSVGAVFFGLWLIPMGHVAAASGRMPKALGWTLIAGGVGYVISALLSNGIVGTPAWLANGLTMPATVGEVWMLGYLLSVGIRPPTDPSHRAD